MGTKISALVAGIAFGFVLAWARLTDYDVIHRMLRLEEYDVFLLMGSTMVIGMLGLRLLRAFGARTFATGERVAWTVSKPTRAVVFGSIVFGIGWSIAGTCPGPAVVQIGRGQLAGLFTGAGIFVGVLLAGWFRASRSTRTRAPAPDGAKTMPL